MLVNVAAALAPTTRSGARTSDFGRPRAALGQGLARPAATASGISDTSRCRARQKNRPPRGRSICKPGSRFGQAAPRSAAPFFFLLYQPKRAKAPRPLTNRGSPAGSGVGVTSLRSPTIVPVSAKVSKSPVPTKPVSTAFNRRLQPSAKGPKSRRTDGEIVTVADIDIKGDRQSLCARTRPSVKFSVNEYEFQHQVRSH